MIKKNKNSEEIMKKRYLSLIAALIAVPASLDATVAKWDTKFIHAYERPYIDSKFVKLTEYKIGDSYEVIACNQYDWCKSKDGYIKKHVLKFNEKPQFNNELEGLIISSSTEEQTATEVEVIENKISINEVKIQKKDELPVKKNISINHNVIELSIKKLIKEMIKRNSNVLFERLQGHILDEQVKYEKDILDPSFYVNLTRQRTNTPNNTEDTISRGYLSTYSEMSNTMQMGFNGLLATGAQWDIGIKSNDRKSSLIDRYKDYDTEYDNSLELSFSQPLLKGFGSDITLSKYHLAKADKSIYINEYKKKLMDIMGSAIHIYWKLYAANELKRSWEKSLDINRKAISILEQKAKSGDIPYSEVLEAKNGIMTREAEYNKMSVKSIEIKNEILTMLNVSVQANRDIDFKLLETPFLTKNQNFSLEEYYENALNNWPEFAIVKEKLKKETFQVKVAKNQSKPKLDLVGSASTATLSDEREMRLYEDEFLSWSVGLQFNIPISNDRAKSMTHMAKLKKQQVELELNTLEKGLLNAISTKLEVLVNSKKQVEYFQNGLAIKNQLLDYERKGFSLGEKNIRDILIQEEDIITYQRKLFNTIIDWKLAQASLDKAVGILFSKYFSFEDIERIKNIKMKDKLTNTDFGNFQKTKGKDK